MAVQLTPDSILKSVPKQLFEDDGLGVRIDSRKSVIISTVSDSEDFLALEDEDELDDEEEILLQESEVKLLEKAIALLKEFHATNTEVSFSISSNKLSVENGNGVIDIPIDVALQIRGEFLGYLKKNIGYGKKDAATNDSTPVAATLSDPTPIDMDGDLVEGLDDTAA